MFGQYCHVLCLFSVNGVKGMECEVNEFLLTITLANTTRHTPKQNRQAVRLIIYLDCAVTH